MSRFKPCKWCGAAGSDLCAACRITRNNKFLHLQMLLLIGALIFGIALFYRVAASANSAPSVPRVHGAVCAVCAIGHT